MTYPFASLGAGVSIHHACDWSKSQAHRMKLGNRVQIRKDARLHIEEPLEGDERPAIVIDDETCLGPGCQLIAKNSIHIERDVLVGQSVLITDAGFAPEGAAGSRPGGCVSRGGRIRIGQGSWIGFRAAIVCTEGELVLGRNCVVAANAVVTRSFPPYSVLFGNPAKVIRQFNPEKNRWVLKTA